MFKDNDHQKQSLKNNFVKICKAITQYAKETNIIPVAFVSYSCPFQYPVIFSSAATRNNKMEKYHTVVTNPKSYRKIIERGKIYTILLKDITAELLSMVQALR
jgi:hypothetical protein